MGEVSSARARIVEGARLTLRPNPRIVGNLEGSQKDKRRAQKNLSSRLYDIKLVKSVDR